jgi:flagellar basal-body rod modification protein FlgD
MSIQVNSTSSATAADLSGSSRLPEKVLGQDDFLKLLVAQMTSQDPLNPMSNADFITQMAQFSALEQSRAMTADLAEMRVEQTLLRANTLIGKQVTLQLDDTTTATGVVSAVQIDAGTPKIVVSGVPFELSQVLGVEPAPAAPTNTGNPSPVASSGTVPSVVEQLFTQP